MVGSRVSPLAFFVRVWNTLCRHNLFNIGNVSDTSADCAACLAGANVTLGEELKCFPPFSQNAASSGSRQTVHTRHSG